MTTSQTTESRQERSQALVATQWLREHPWVWAFVAAVAVWVTISVITRSNPLGTLGTTFSLVPFLVIVGIGQMLVITLGNGHIDLSVPQLITLSAYVSTGVFAAGHGSLAFGLAVSAGLGILVALLNVLAIVVLRVPPIVATLAVGMMIQSAVLVTAGRLSAVPDPRVVAFTRLQVGGVSIMGLLCIALAVLASFVLFRTTYGRAVQAVGQSASATMLSGVSVNRTILGTYIISGLCASLAGVLLGAFSSPNLGLGQPYMMNSVAAVVLGGSLISGGKSNVTGIWGAALFLLLLTTLLDVTGASFAVQNIVKGLLIILVLILVGADKKR